MFSSLHIISLLLTAGIGNPLFLEKIRGPIFKNFFHQKTLIVYLSSTHTPSFKCSWCSFSSHISHYNIS